MTQNVADLVGDTNFVVNDLIYGFSGTPNISAVPYSVDDLDLCMESRAANGNGSGCC